MMTRVVFDNNDSDNNDSDDGYALHSFARTKRSPSSPVPPSKRPRTDPATAAASSSIPTPTTTITSTSIPSPSHSGGGSSSGSGGKQPLFSEQQKQAIQQYASEGVTPAKDIDKFLQLYTEVNALGGSSITPTQLKWKLSNMRYNSKIGGGAGNKSATATAGSASTTKSGGPGKRIYNDSQNAGDDTSGCISFDALLDEINWARTRRAPIISALQLRNKLNYERRRVRAREEGAEGSDTEGEEAEAEEDSHEKDREEELASEPSRQLRRPAGRSIVERRPRDANLTTSTSRNVVASSSTPRQVRAEPSATRPLRPDAQPEMDDEMLLWWYDGAVFGPSLPDRGGARQKYRQWHGRGFLLCQQGRKAEDDDFMAWWYEGSLFLAESKDRDAYRSWHTRALYLS